MTTDNRERKSTMIDPSSLADLARLAAESGVTELEWQQGASRVTLKLAPVRRLRTTSEPKPREAQPVRSPHFGEFCRLSASGLAEPSCVGQGQIIGHVRLGPVLVAVRAPCDGLLRGQGPANGALVGYGDHLFEIVADEDPGQ